MEFQPVLLAGGVSRRLYPLTEATPKSLLPVGNRPLISYQLELLEKAGFKEAIVLSPESGSDKVQKFLKNTYKGSLATDLVVFDDLLSTTAALLKIKDKIRHDFILISGDLVVDPSFIHKILDLHRVQTATVTVLLQKQKETQSKPIKTRKLDFFGLDKSKNRLLFYESEKSRESSLFLDKSLLTKFPHLTIQTNLIDAHFYVFSKWALEILEKYDVQDPLPFLVKCQYQTSLVSGLNVPSPFTLSLKMTSSHHTDQDKIKCMAFTLDDQLYCSRANDILSYLEINREIASGNKPYKPIEPFKKNAFLSDTVQIHVKTQIGSECIVGDHTKIGERCGIKKSCIGRSCQIGDNVKIINSVIMDNVVIAKDCKIQWSVVCSNAVISENATISESQIGTSYHLEANAVVKKDILV